jgi:hypothetical protein
LQDSPSTLIKGFQVAVTAHDANQHQHGKHDTHMQAQEPYTTACTQQGNTHHNQQQQPATHPPCQLISIFV